MTDEQTTPGPIDNSHLMAKTTNPEPKEPQKEAQAATVEADGNTSVESAPPENEDAKPPKKPGVHNRIGELTKEKHDAKREAEAAQREAEYWRQQALKAAEQKPEPTQADAPTGEPTREQFDYDDAQYMKAWYKWQREQERVEESKQKQQEAAQEKWRKFAEKEQAFAAEHPDYEQVAKYQAPITQPMAEAILEADDAPAIAYYLGQNLEEASAIAAMSPIAAARAIGRIEAKLSAKTAVPAPTTPTKTVTRAPEPVTTLSGSPAVTRSYDEMSMDEYDAVRRKERAAKGQRP